MKILGDKMEDKYYLYRHVRLDSNKPFYIGIGTKRIDGNCFEVEYERAFYTKNRNKTWTSIATRCGYKVEIVFETNTREEISAKEKEFIQLYGRITDKTGSLVNYTNGGDNDFVFSLESRKKMSDSHKKLYLDGFINPMTGKNLSRQAKIKKSRPVIQYDLLGNKLQEFYGLTEAALQTNSDYRLIHKVCNGIRTRHNGFIWKYKPNE